MFRESWSIVCYTDCEKRFTGDQTDYESHRRLYRGRGYRSSRVRGSSPFRPNGYVPSTALLLGHRVSQLR